GGDAQVERRGLGDPTGTAALRALLVDDRAHALALPARLAERERALVGGDQAGAVADRAGPGLGAGLGSVPVACVTYTRRPQRDRQGGAVHRVGEVQRHLRLHVATALRPAPAPATSRPPPTHPRAPQLRPPPPPQPPIP